MFIINLIKNILRCIFFILPGCFGLFKYPLKKTYLDKIVENEFYSIVIKIRKNVSTKYLKSDVKKFNKLINKYHTPCNDVTDVVFSGVYHTVAFYNLDLTKVKGERSNTFLWVKNWRQIYKQLINKKEYYAAPSFGVTFFVNEKKVNSLENSIIKLNSNLKCTEIYYSNKSEFFQCSLNRAIESNYPEEIKWDTECSYGPSHLIDVKGSIKMNKNKLVCFNCGEIHPSKSLKRQYFKHVNEVISKCQT